MLNEFGYPLWEEDPVFRTISCWTDQALGIEMEEFCNEHNIKVLFKNDGEYRVPTISEIIHPMQTSNGTTSILGFQREWKFETDEDFLLFKMRFA